MKMIGKIANVFGVVVKYGAVIMAIMKIFEFAKDEFEKLKTESDGKKE